MAPRHRSELGKPTTVFNGEIGPFLEDSREVYAKRPRYLGPEVLQASQGDDFRLQEAHLQALHGSSRIMIMHSRLQNNQGFEAKLEAQLGSRRAHIRICSPSGL